MLQARSDGKSTEDNEKNEEIIDAQCFFNQITGEEFERLLRAGITQDADAEQHRKADPCQTPQRRFAQSDFARPPVKDAEVLRRERWLWARLCADRIQSLRCYALAPLDLGVLHRRPRKIGCAKAALWSLAWISFRCCSGIGILRYSGPQKALEFFTGYLIEKALSVDNLFIFLIIFRTFAVAPRLQHRILAWGILGALIMRGAMIAAGAELIEHYSW